MTDYHESWEALPEQARDIHRAIASLKEEIEAVDWYHQRVVLCSDPQLREVLAHNRDEEIEHAVMTLEWLRRNMPKWDQNLRKYLFTEANITAIEDAEEPAAPGSVGDLGIGKPSRS
jgi:ferritin-like protein